MLGIIAGGGDLPIELAKVLQARGQPFHIIGIRGEADEGIRDFPHNWIEWGQIGKLFRSLKAAQCRDLVLLGRVSRPDLRSVRLDWGAIKLVPFILKLTRGGDDSVLSRIVGLFQQRGFEVRAIPEVAPELVARLGVLGQHSPGQSDYLDIARGLSLIERLGEFDIGQAVVVVHEHVLAVEAVEGTDAMLGRCAELRQWGMGERRGVLVKSPKPQQDLRVDLPTIGPETVKRAAAAGLAGIAVVAGKTLLAQQAELIRLADEENLFLVGVDEKTAG